MASKDGLNTPGLPPDSLSSGAVASPDLLDKDHLQAFRRALLNILATDLAEFAYAQILDGLPTEQFFNES